MSDDHHVITDELYEQIGKALSVWSGVEETLCTLYALATVGKVTEPIGAATSAFWAILSFDGKLKMTTAAIRFCFADNKFILEEWKPIANALNTKSKKRNDLAHGTVATWHYIDRNTGQETKDTCFAPSLYKQMNEMIVEHQTGAIDIAQMSDIRPRVRLYRKDIKERRKGFETINTRLRQFRGRFWAELEQREQYREQAGAKVRDNQNDHN